MITNNKIIPTHTHTHTYTHMQSPFSSPESGTTFVLYLEPILNSYSNTYQNVITLSGMPCGPLSDMVTMISTKKLSPFQESPTNGNSCTFVLLRYPKNVCGVGSSIKNPDFYMGIDDIPSVLSYLQTHGYTVDTKLTKMLAESRITMGGLSDTRISADRKMICIVGKNSYT